MALQPSIGNLRPRKTDPETMDRIGTFFKLPPEWQEFVKYYGHRYSDKDDPVALVRALYNSINPPTSSLGFKLEQSEAGRNEVHTDAMMSQTPADVLNRRVGSPFTFSALMIAALRESNVEANLSYIRPLQASARDADGNVKQGMVAVLLAGNVPDGIRYDRFETDEKLRKEVSTMLGPTALEFMKKGELHMVLANFDTAGKLGEQYKDVKILSDEKAASIRFCNLGNYALNAGRREEAEKNYQTAKILWSENPVVYECLARFHLSAREPNGNEALKASLRSVELEPQNHKAQRLVGMALMELGRPLLALKSFERAAKLAPDDPAVYAALGDAYFELGKTTRKDSSRESKDEALKSLRTSVEEYARAEMLLNAQGVTSVPVRNSLDAVMAAKAAAMQALANVQQELGVMPTRQRMAA